MKKLLALLAFFSMIFMISCNEDDDNGPTPSGPSFSVTNITETKDHDGNEETEEVEYKQNLVEGVIDRDFTFTNDTVWVLDGRVVVAEGATLTIEAGTIIKGREGEGALASVLIIARGGKIMAEGTAASPIIFTSALDLINVGEKVGPNLDETDNSLWGGLIILGNAPISANAEAVQIEGIPADETYGLYGGTVTDDNSGVIKYVSVRHGGSLIGEGNEINGITFGGVGSGTTVEYIEVVGNKDDGIEWFGGTVNVSNALVFAADDDAIDIDQAYAGTIDNFIIVNFAGTDHAFEIDGPEGSSTGSFTLTNGTVKGDVNEMADLRDGAVGAIENVYFFNFPDPVASEGEGDISFSDDTPDNWANGSLTLSGLEFTLATDATLAGVFEGTTLTEAEIAEVATVVTTPTVGATKSAFTGWTYADAKGALADF